MKKKFHTTFGIGYDDYLNEGTTINLGAKLKNQIRNTERRSNKNTS